MKTVIGNDEMIFFQDVTAGQPVRNVIPADYTGLGDYPHADIEDLLQIEESVRDRVAAAEATRVAEEVMDRLPKDQAQTEQMIREDYGLARNMSWGMVIRQYLLNDLSQVHDKRVGRRDYQRA
jgi:acetylornithine deacetylase/succinyl-diaminopimelate desuccinylase-like protein